MSSNLEFRVRLGCFHRKNAGDLGSGSAGHRAIVIECHRDRVPSRTKLPHGGRDSETEFVLFSADEWILGQYLEIAGQITDHSQRPAADHFESKFLFFFGNDPPSFRSHPRIRLV
ncbi:hypothetical protein OAG82_01880 [Rubripirellula sp.]|nr:hypothetical protein [Rubripirellula sp.]MDB4621585.1 hypothetical protein [Rubripirellula sp.]